MKFTEFDLQDELLESISYMGFEDSTPIQEKAIPEILKGNDLIACAQTGTGKTAAFLLPLLDQLMTHKSNKTDALIIVPTRELALQIDQQVQGIGYMAGITSASIVGGGQGDDWEAQRRALKSGCNVIIATPGKLISHLNMGYAKLDEIKYLILDEADRMLDIGFHDDIMKIISYVPKQRQTLLFSATMPPKIKTFANKILTNPVEISIAVSKPAEGALQAAYLIHDQQKNELINKLISDKPDYKSILIFSSTKRKVAQIVRDLKRNDFTVEAMSSDLEQDEREEVLNRFKAKNTRVLVATDVLSRGIDIQDINLVINYDVPGDAEDYVHRIGRTARASTTGVGLTFVNKDDIYKFHRIEKLIEAEVMKIPLPPELGEGPEWEMPNQNRGKRKNYNKKNHPKNKSRSQNKNHGKQ
ncbi:MAG: DEAD/DEAH box helicase [Bacteroidetes bacterium]|jgi:superfamily II DNA/RNA helicase|nr:DEAD/DEAH box helicase [Bacteroidota bacterium]